MKISMIIIGWIAILMLPMNVHRLIYDESIQTRWGTFYGSTAKSMMLGYTTLGLIFGWYAVRETILWMKKKKSLGTKNKENEGSNGQ